MKRKILSICLVLIFCAGIFSFIPLFSDEQEDCGDLGCMGAAACTKGADDWDYCTFIPCQGGGSISCHYPI